MIFSVDLLADVQSSSKNMHLVIDARCLQEAVMATRPAQQALVPGRAVLVSNPVNGMSELGVILGEPPAAGAARGAATPGLQPALVAYDART